jgi:pSer/pThr/pTyr-binding forkhead associated (FHA) protein
LSKIGARLRGGKRHARGPSDDRTDSDPTVKINPEQDRESHGGDIRTDPAKPAVVPSEARNDTIIDPGGTQRRRVVAVLLGIEGPLEGHVIRVFAGENLIGREGDPDPIPDTRESKFISKRHAQLIADAGYFAVAPVAEKNATLVNDRRIEAREFIQNGDRLGLGSRPTSFVLLVP